jgi:glycosyltransferase involved in cell wall biosynthesis
MQGVSIVTGTLNREEYLPDLISNTVDSGSVVNVELVLVDGGSTDGTIEYLDKLNHPNIKLIKYGKRSPYPHYMNLGVAHASHDLICQWNDDILLVNDWEDVFSQIDEDHDAYLFNWKEGSSYDTEDESWLKCNHMRDNGWNLHNCADYSYPNPVRGEIVMNYGIYKKNVFRKHGLYNDEYNYYCADGEMSMRAYYGGAKFKTCIDIKVCVLPAEKRAIMDSADISRYHSACTRILKNSYQFLGEFLT